MTKFYIDVLLTAITFGFYAPVLIFMYTNDLSLIPDLEISPFHKMQNLALIGGLPFQIIF